MAVQPEDLELFVTRTGPVHVIAEDGSAVAYGSSGRLDMVDPEQKDAWTVADVQVTLPDEQARATRSIPGGTVVEVREENVGYTLVVDHTVEPDPGPAVSTRGA
jgi:hypothetical protein